MGCSLQGGGTWRRSWDGESVRHREEGEWLEPRGLERESVQLSAPRAAEAAEAAGGPFPEE